MNGILAVLQATQTTLYLDVTNVSRSRQFKLIYPYIHKRLYIMYWHIYLWFTKQKYMIPNKIYLF